MSQKVNYQKFLYMMQQRCSPAGINIFEMTHNDGLSLLFFWVLFNLFHLGYFLFLQAIWLWLLQQCSTSRISRLSNKAQIKYFYNLSLPFSDVLIFLNWDIFYYYFVFWFCVLFAIAIGDFVCFGVGLVTLSLSVAAADNIGRRHAIRNTSKRFCDWFEEWKVIGQCLLSCWHGD